MKRVKFCPKCMNIIHKKDEECSQCGMKVSEMVQDESLSIMPKFTKQEEVIVGDDGKELSKKEIRKLKENKVIDFEKEFYGEESESEQNENSSDASEESKNKPKRHKHKSKKKNVPNYTVDAEGEFDINTKDVTFFENQEEYSVKKARGDYEPEKLKWWEIYKWADRMLARRKVMKEVNKAAVVRPEFVNKGILAILCLLFGWMGAHNFYAKNNAKGWTVLGMFVAALIIVQVPVLYQFMGIFVGGGLGFIVISMWFYDFICICFNRYKFRITKMQFIRKLNTETRAKLGKKYINMK